jgi:hypothetical protein
MKMTWTFLIALALTALGSSAPAADVQTGISIGSDGVKGFYLAIGETYRVSEKEVVTIHDRRVPDDELPVVFFIARRAGVPARTVAEFRLEGKPWIEVALHFGLGADAFYVEYNDVPKGPYGHAYGYYRNHPRKEWRTLRLDDAAVIDLVNLRFVVDRYRCTPDDVFRMRADRKSFVAIHDEAGRGHHKDKAAEKKKKVIVVESTKEKHGHKQHGD